MQSIDNYPFMILVKPGFSIEYGLLISAIVLGIILLRANYSAPCGEELLIDYLSTRFDTSDEYDKKMLENDEKILNKLTDIRQSI